MTNKLPSESYSRILWLLRSAILTEEVRKRRRRRKNIDVTMAIPLSELLLQASQPSKLINRHLHATNATPQNTDKPQQDWVLLLWPPAWHSDTQTWSVFTKSLRKGSIATEEWECSFSVLNAKPETCFWIQLPWLQVHIVNGIASAVHMLMGHVFRVN